MLCACGCKEEAGTYTSGSRKGKAKKYAYGHRCRLPRKKKTHCKRRHALSSENTDSEGRCKICKREQGTQWRRDNPEKSLAINRKYHYGITEEETRSRLEQQGHKCLICSASITFSSAHVDHVHDETKSVRGLLCAACNKGLGQFKDSLDLLEKAVQYIKTFLLQRPTSV